MLMDGRKRVHKGLMLLSILLLMFALAGCGSKSKETPVETPAEKPAAQDLETVKHLDKMPEMEIDPNKSYSAVFHTRKGDFTMELFSSDAPTTVNNFVYLAKHKFYNGIFFHRIVETFMIQTGDPNGTGKGGPGYNIPDELGTEHKYEVGTVAMANTGSPNSGGSQFFICTGEICQGLNNQPIYTIFGKISEGMDTVTNIAKTPVEANPISGEMSTPTEKVIINSIDIIEK